MSWYGYRELSGDREFRCSECGRKKKVKYVPVSNLCRSCAAKKAAEKRSVSNTLTTLTSTANKTNNKANIIADVAETEDLVVTKAVEQRLKKDAESLIPSIPKSTYEELAFWVEITYGVLFVIFSWFFLSDKINAILWLALIGIGILLYLVINVTLAKPRRERKRQIVEREGQVTLKVRELAEERQRNIEERQQFYSSPEWIKLREQVIEEEGRICAECGKKINQSFDLTVDHKYPRKKYPELALSRDNLRVLCRKCNSKKGSGDWIDVLVQTGELKK